MHRRLGCSDLLGATSPGRGSLAAGAGREEADTEQRSSGQGAPPAGGRAWPGQRWCFCAWRQLCRVGENGLRMPSLAGEIKWMLSWPLLRVDRSDKATNPGVSEQKFSCASGCVRSGQRLSVGQVSGQAPGRHPPRSVPCAAPQSNSRGETSRKGILGEVSLQRQQPMNTPVPTDLIAGSRPKDLQELDSACAQSMRRNSNFMSISFN